MAHEARELTAEDVKRRHADLRPVLHEWRETLHSSPNLTDDDKYDFRRASKDRDMALLGVEEHERREGATLDTAKAKLAIDYDYASFLGDELADRLKAAGRSREASFYFEQGETFAAEAEQLDSEAMFARYLPVSQFDDEEEEQKRRAGQTLDAGNPGNAQLGANIRPEVGSGPGGLETYTTQKSVVYEAFPNAEREAEAPVEEIDEVRDQNEIRLRTEEQQQGDGLTPAEPAETRKMTPQERQDARREAREAAELDHRSELDARSAALDRSGRNLDHEESHTLSAGISL